MMKQKDNVKFILLDVWETLLLSNKNIKYINYDRAKIILDITKCRDIEFWKNKIEDEILKFKRQELLGLSITPIERIENLLTLNNINKKISKKILYEYDKLIIEKYRPSLNKKLLNTLIRTQCNIILISNTGLTTKNAIIEILKKYNIISNFKGMFFSQDYHFCKPSILFYMIPLKLYNINMDEVIMYGDSKIMDLEPCNKLGINCIIKNWGDIQYND